MDTVVLEGIATISKENGLYVEALFDTGGLVMYLTSLVLQKRVSG
jgi:hypothetical protein